VEPEPIRSWLTNRRTIVFGIGCGLVGFLIALFIFEEPWRLPPNWGDIPTWLAVLAASVGGWIALSQLSQQQAVITADFARSERRDDLLDRQRRELQSNEESRQRAQADGVDFTCWLAGAVIVLSLPPWQPTATIVLVVENKSKRPIRNVECRICPEAGPTQIADGKGYMSPADVADQRERPHLFDPNPGPTVEVIRAGDRYGFLFAHAIAQGANAPPHVTTFTDDADISWQLDQDMRLTRLEGPAD
jgi:hypothetical protein